jgi:hypothetical protein
VVVQQPWLLMVRELDMIIISVTRTQTMALFETAFAATLPHERWAAWDVGREPSAIVRQAVCGSPWPWPCWCSWT